EPPPSYPAAGIADLSAARSALHEVASRFSSTWPELQQIAVLTDLGIYDLSGPMLAAAHQERADSLRGRGRHAAEARAWTPTTEAWRGLFLLARDHHHTAKTTWGLWRSVPPERTEAAWKIAYPIAHDRAVWTASREADLDPFLVLGLMRQESTYNAIARSPVGARGAMQIMPRTGHLMADLAHDIGYSSGDLEDPGFAIDMGIDYLALLHERFDGVSPLAIASYNAGPFNVSGWLGNTGAAMPLDAWVEHIPYKETRDYVKRVTGGWSAYVALYGESDAAVVLPATPAGDHPEIVDF
ncbi:MAG: lytic transglycosylase domain-containing protein, partial [Deltaproteobacteria bacterium]|nr:lytic transglycosylase domain-containing protein [Deltaproteobacteria bacterium]